MPTDAVTPEYAVQGKLVEIWKELLSIPSVDPSQNFFELGGDSISTMMLMAQIEQHFGVWIEMADLFDNPTIAELASLLARAGIQPEIR